MVSPFNDDSKLNSGFQSTSKVEKVCVFGDSWSDTGRVYKLTNGTWPLKVYHDGRFSNGLLWHEHASRKVFPTSVTWNFAHGGATSDSTVTKGFSGPNSDVLVPGLYQQACLYISTIQRGLRQYDNLATADFKTLFILSLAGNDFYFSTCGSNPQIPQPHRIARNVVRTMELLYRKAGARLFLVTEMPPMGAYPFWHPNLACRVLSNMNAYWYNRKLHALLKIFKRKHSDVIVPIFQQYSFVSNVCQNPRDFGFLYSSIAFNTAEDKPVADFVFYDGFHPTANMHRLLGEACAMLLEKELLVVPKARVTLFPALTEVESISSCRDSCEYAM